MAFGTPRVLEAVQRVQETCGTAGKLVSSLSTTLQIRFDNLIEAVNKVRADNNARLDAIQANLHLLRTSADVDDLRSEIVRLRGAIEERQSERACLDVEDLRGEIARLREIVEDRQSEAAIPNPPPEAAHHTGEAPHPAAPQPAPQPAPGPAPDPAPAAPQASPAVAGEDPAPPPANGSPDIPSACGQDEDDHGRKHYALLLDAAGIASAGLVCHRDLWAFFIEKAAREKHFRVPGKVEDLSNGKVRITLSGRTLIAALTALWDLRRDSRGKNGSKGDWALSHELYEAIAEVVRATRNSPRGGGSGDVAITIDRRSDPAPYATAGNPDEPAPAPAAPESAAEPPDDPAD